MTYFGRLLFYWLPVAAYASLILSLSSIPGIPGAPRVPDKALHALEYFLFGVLLARAFLQGSNPTRQKLVNVVLAGAAFAALDEYYQSFIPGRFSSVYDWIADVTGIGLVISLLLLRRIKEQASG
jgi:VanZ family protein